MKASIIAVVILCLTVLVIFPQERDSLVQLTESLGDTIDRHEMKRFNILNLNQLKGFSSLVFFLRDDTSLVAKILFVDNKGNLKDSTPVYKVNRLNNLRASMCKKEQAELERLAEYQKVLLVSTDALQYDGVIQYIEGDILILVNVTANDNGNYKSRISTPFYKNQIESVFIKGESKVWSGIQTGGLFGFTLGAILGLASGNDNSGWFRMSAGQKALVGGVTLGVIGSAIGLVVGIVSSSDDKTIHINSDSDFRELEKYVIK